MHNDIDVDLQLNSAISFMTRRPGSGNKVNHKLQYIFSHESNLYRVSEVVLVIPYHHSRRGRANVMLGQ